MYCFLMEAEEESFFLPVWLLEVACIPSLTASFYVFNTVRGYAATLHGTVSTAVISDVPLT